MIGHEPTSSMRPLLSRDPTSGRVPASVAPHNHRNRSLAPGELDRLNLNRFEAGLLIDAAVPWHPAKHVGRLWSWDSPERKAAMERARQEQAWWTPIRKAAYRLAARGLVRIGHQRQDFMRKYPRIIIERTELGSQFLARRHNELHVNAQHVGEAATCDREEIAWRTETYEQRVAADVAMHERWERERAKEARG